MVTKPPEQVKDDDILTASHVSDELRCEVIE